MTTPLDRSASWPYVDGEPGRFSYVRAEHPTQVACEEALGALDGGHALLYPSGMGAVTTAFLTLLSPGKTLAHLHDAIVVPRAAADEPPDLAVLENELVRAIEFGKTALNPSAITDLERIALAFGIDRAKYFEGGMVDDKSAE